MFWISYVSYFQMSTGVEWVRQGLLVAVIWQTYHSVGNVNTFLEFGVNTFRSHLSSLLYGSSCGVNPFRVDSSSRELLFKMANALYYRSLVGNFLRFSLIICVFFLTRTALSIFSIPLDSMGM